VYQHTGSTLDTKTIIEKYSYIFEWLQLFDFNIVILIVMILVATINMVVALLVLILERTQIRNIKALGAIIGASVKYFFIMRLSNSSDCSGELIGIAILLLPEIFWNNQTQS
jgi:lipoprotein-releasing system permease protein